VIDGERVGELLVPDYFNGDVMAIPGQIDPGALMPGDKTLVEAWHRRSLEEQALLTEGQEQELRTIEREGWREVWTALERMDRRDRKEANARAKSLRVALGTHNLHGRKLKWPFGPPIRPYRGWEKHSIYIAPAPEGWVEPQWPPTEAEQWAARREQWAAQAKADEKKLRKQREQRERDRPPPPPPRPVQARDQQAPVRITDGNGIERVIPLEVYERYGREAIPLGVDPPVWVIYRLGYGWMG
jgi:hypothetical protein